MALSAARNTPILGAGGVPVKAFYPVAASTIIYEGALVCLDSSGNLVPGSISTTLKACGIALQTVDNSAGAAAALNCEVQQGAARFVNSNSMTKASVGALGYIVDDQSVSSSSNGSTRSIAGTIYLVDTNGVWVYVGLSAPVDAVALTAALSAYAATTNGAGASLIGVEDAGTLFAGTTVEAVLAEIGADIVGIGSAPQALTGAGACNVTSLVTLFTSSGGAQALTLANGTQVGQLKIVHHTVDGGSGVLTPTTAGNFANFTLTAIHDACLLQWSGTAWNILLNVGGTVG